MSEAPASASSATLPEELVSLYRQVASGAMTLTHGLSVARALPLRAEFDDAGLFPMANAVVGAARRGHVQAAALQWRLVLEALDHARTDRQRKEVSEASQAWLYIATYFAIQYPDGRIVADARRRGAGQIDALLLSDATKSNAADLLHDLGALLSEPYISGRDDTNFAAQTANWLAEGRANRVALDLAGSEEMPSPPEALADAAEMFRRAADLREGRKRGRSLKALSDALIWRSIAGGPMDRERIATAMSEAWTLLDPIEDAELSLMLAQNARVFGLALPERQPSPVPDATELERLKHDDPQAFIYAITRNAARASDPRAAIGHLLHGVSFAGESGDEQTMANLVLRLAAEAGRLFEIADRIPQDDVSREAWAAAAQALQVRAEADGWLAADRALAMLAFAMVASKADREDVAVPLLMEAWRLNLDEQPGLETAVTTALAQLSWYQAATDYKAGRFHEACALYLKASGIAARLGLPGLARRNLDRAIDAFKELTDITEPRIVVAAAQSLPRVQSDAPDLAYDIRQLWLLIVSHAAFVAERDEPLPIAMQAAKGASLVIARSAHAHRPPLARPAVEAALAHWQAAAAQAVDAPPAAYDEERLLLAYADSIERPGTTAAEQMENLARRVDRTLAAELARGAPPDSPMALDPETLCALVPEGSVVVSLYPCFTEDHQTAYVTLLATREGVSIRRTRSRVPFMELQIDHISSDDLAHVVADVRGPLLGEADAAALDAALERAFDYVLGAVEGELAALHQRGYRHLCVNPHGALHFCPLPLLGRGGKRLADDWIVTHLPALGLLARDEVAESHTRVGAGVFALSFSDARTGLPPLPAAVQEAERIGAAIGAPVFVDRTATVERFNTALRQHRWIHVATHGHHDPVAPALQTIYLHSGRRHVVAYRAYEVLQHQLAGLDLVTLSACETALGRIDINDNPRGLQAFLFTAGVATIVTCLWPVDDDAAAAFFECLYGELAGGRSKLHAFAAAQRRVRKQFPDLLDWGAFQYSGTWEAA